MKLRQLNAENIAKLGRIADAFERSRFDYIQLEWPGGNFAVRKTPAVAATPLTDVPSPRIGLFRGNPGLAIGAGFAAARGETLGFVDLLGERYPVIAPCDGTVVAVCVQEGGFVEYGATMFRLAPPSDRERHPQ